MKPVHIVATCAAALGLLGGALIFAPLETAGWFGWQMDQELPLSLLGSAIFGLALLNWMGRNAVYGGIYGRPILLGNLAHAFAGFMALIGVATLDGPWPILAVTVFYGLYAAGYARIMFSPPYNSASNERPAV
ncbi:MAG: hypothetical protein RIE53_01245 [Rhodothermales bacterium]